MSDAIALKQSLVQFLFWLGVAILLGTAFLWLVVNTATDEPRQTTNDPDHDEFPCL